MNIVLSTAVTGLVSSVISEIFKFIPALRKNELVSTIVAIIVVAIAAFVSNGMTWSIDNAIAVLVFSLVSYKTVVQPLAQSVNSPTQQ
jgi:hypothetical protein